MEMTFEQAMRPGMLQAFATRRGSGYMMRSEKRGGGSYSGGPGRKPPRRKKAGFIYIFFTLLISLILWPVGMVMLWRRKVRLQAGTKLLISLLTLCLSVFLIVFALMVPVDNPEYTAFQDRANDWLDKAAVDVAAAGDAAYKKGSETVQIMSDFAQAGSDYVLVTGADALDKGVELAGTARTSIEGLFHKDQPEPTEAPIETTDAPEDTEATDAPEDTEQPTVVDEPIETEAAPEETEATGEDLDIRLPEATPDEADAQPLEEGALQSDGSFVAGAEPIEEATEEPTEAPVEEPTEEPAEEPTEAPAEEATEAPVEEATEAPAEEATAEPAEEVTEAPAEENVASPFELYTPQPEADAEPEQPAEAAAPGAVKSAGDATVYYYTDGSKGFHRTPTRHGMGNAPAHTLAEAFADGKHTCQSCNMPDESILTEEHIAWVDESNVIHTTDECASFDGEWRLMPLAEAVEAGDTACPDCGATDYVEGIYPAPTATPEPEIVNPATALKPVGDIIVYFYDSGVGYHVKPDCVNMSGAPAGTLAEAVAAGKHACGNCNPPDASLIGLPMLWLDESKVCHTSDECAAFNGQYSLIARDDALAQGLTACPDCGAADYLVPGTLLAGE